MDEIPSVLVLLNLKVASLSPKALEADFQKDVVAIIKRATQLVVQKTMK